jgi:hypothetical protein
VSKTARSLSRQCSRAASAERTSGVRMMWDSARNGACLWGRRHPRTSVNICLSDLWASLLWNFLNGVYVECRSYYSPPPRLRLRHQSLIPRQETPRCKRLIISFNTRKDSLECESLVRIMYIFLTYDTALSYPSYHNHKYGRKTLTAQARHVTPSHRRWPSSYRNCVFRGSPQHPPRRSGLPWRHPVVHGYERCKRETYLD